MRALCLVLASWCAVLFLATGTAMADHNAAQCNIRPQTDYYNCRGAAVQRCFKAQNIPTVICQKRKAICERCIERLFTCAKKIGHTVLLRKSCESCRDAYQRCTRTLPKLPET